MSMQGAGERVWLKEYMPGVPADIDPQRHASLAEVIERSCDKYRDRPAYENLGVTLSYDDVDRLS